MSHSLFLNTKPSKLFWRTAIPGGISMVASSLYGLFESILVGKILGTTAFAAISFSFPIIVINFSLAELIGVGSSVPISIFLGQKKEEKANNYFTCSILLTIITGLLSGGLIFFGAPTLLRMLGAEGEMLNYCVTYLRIYAISSPITPLMYSLDNYLRISGKIKSSMMLNIFFCVFSIGLEWIFLRFIIKDVSGAAFGTIIAMTVCIIISVVMFLPGKLQLKFVRPRFSFDMIKQIYKNGIAPFLTNISGRLFSFVMNGMLLLFGGEAAVAVYGVVMTLCGVVEQKIYGTIDSLQPAIGCNYGAGRYDRIKTLEKYVLASAATISLVFGAVIFLFPEAATKLFLEDVSLLDMAVGAVKITCLTFIFKWFATAVQCFFMALEKPALAMVISIASACAFPLALIPALLPIRLTGLWWNYPLSTILATGLALVIIIKQKNKLF